MQDGTDIRRVFKGRVKSRSSRHKSGPPGEREIMRNNPKVVEIIRTEMGWDRVELGTLNVECDESTLEELVAQFEPTFYIQAEAVKYPERYAHIPRKREQYVYFRAEMRFKNDRYQVLLRRAKNPVKGRVEVIADINLRETFQLRDEDEIVLEVLV